MVESRTELSRKETRMRQSAESRCLMHLSLRWDALHSASELRHEIVTVPVTMDTIEILNIQKMYSYMAVFMYIIFCVCVSAQDTRIPFNKMHNSRMGKLLLFFCLCNG